MPPEEKEKFNLPEQEEKIIRFWHEQDVFEKSLAQTKKGKPFVFYEGPPTANGRPGIHHALTRAFKDIILRYKTMRGFFVPRRAGWDTHGLPVEIEIEKELGFQHKQEIERYGIDRFNKKARESVWRYKDEWEKFTQRLGFWLDLKNPYITYETSYMETLWWIMKEIWKKGLLYEDFKVVPWCPRCETGLSSHEVGQGYKKVRENSVYVKFHVKGKPHEYFLVWTTTPWTLPANVAIAVNPKIEYTKYRMNDEYLWSATPPPFENDARVEVVEKVSGKSLIGLKYEPLFTVPKEYSGAIAPEYTVVAGDFVSTEEGTGMVHLAPAFGDDDMRVIKNLHSTTKYPILQTVQQNGTMKKGIIGERQFIKDTDPLIIEDLKRRKLLYAVKPYEHEYPFCWRCATPLLYLAKASWWIAMSTLRTELEARNEKINWIPSHIQHGRFGEFIHDVRDWAFSRERYWGTPLPVWKCSACTHQDVIGSREELSVKVGSTKNRYIIMRHGESISNVQNVVSYALDGRYRETLRGRMQAEKAAKKLAKQKPDMIFTSDVLRTRETAAIVAKQLGIEKVYTDKRLREINTGAFEGRSPKEYDAYFASVEEKFTRKPPGAGGENLNDVRNRVMQFMDDIEQRYSGKTILIVSHEHPLWMLYAGAMGLTNKETIVLRTGKRKNDFINFAQIIDLPYRRVPRDENGEINLHRPYIDKITWKCEKCGGTMKRVSEVVDVWFDSGAMPFAQVHYPFAKDLPAGQADQKLLFPADYICEAVDQTRGWFYTLLAVATLLGKSQPYRNVISLGHVLDKNGIKMSKSKGNVVEPQQMMQKYGADALRWYLYTLNAPGEAKRFDEQDLAGKLRGFLFTLWNSFVLFDTYVNTVKSLNTKIAARNVLDQWIIVRLNSLITDVTKKLDAYDATSAARAIEEFAINDFSQWYLRRSRRRFQHPNDAKEYDEAARTTAHVLLSLCVLIAPFAPFISELMYQRMRKKMNLKKTSVHLEAWPRLDTFDKKRDAGIIKEMDIVRSSVAEALKLRAQAGIKVRQPLAKLILHAQNSKLKNKELLTLIKEEVNVKAVVFGKEMALDTVITPVLKEEGMIRDIIRNVQELRRDSGMKPSQTIRLQFVASSDMRDVLERWKKMFVQQLRATAVVYGGKKVFKAEREMQHDGTTLWIGIR